MQKRRWSNVWRSDDSAQHLSSPTSNSPGIPAHAVPTATDSWGSSTNTTGSNSQRQVRFAEHTQVLQTPRDSSEQSHGEASSSAQEECSGHVAATAAAMSKPAVRFDCTPVQLRVARLEAGTCQDKAPAVPAHKREDMAESSKRTPSPEGHKLSTSPGTESASNTNSSSQSSAQLGSHPEACAESFKIAPASATDVGSNSASLTCSPRPAPLQCCPPPDSCASADSCALDSTTVQRSPDAVLAAWRGKPVGVVNESFDPMRASYYAGAPPAGARSSLAPRFHFAAAPTPPFQRPEASETLLTSSAPDPELSSCSSDARAPGSDTHAVSQHIELPSTDASLTSVATTPSPAPLQRQAHRSVSARRALFDIGAIDSDGVGSAVRTQPSLRERASLSSPADSTPDAHPSRQQQTRSRAAAAPFRSRSNPLSEGDDSAGDAATGAAGSTIAMHAMLDRHADMGGHMLAMWRSMHVDEKGQAVTIAPGCAPQSAQHDLHNSATLALAETHCSLQAPARCHMWHDFG